MNPELIKALQRRIASLAVGASTARGMGPSGTIGAARGFLAELTLVQVRCQTAADFQAILDRATTDYREHLRVGGRESSNRLANALHNRFGKESNY